MRPGLVPDVASDGGASGALRSSKVVHADRRFTKHRVDLVLRAPGKYAAEICLRVERGAVVMKQMLEEEAGRG